MKRSTKFLTTALVAGALIVGGVFVNSTMVSQDDEKMAARAVQEYLNSYKNGDIDTMLKYVKDTRVADQAELKDQYEQYVKQNKDHTGMKFLSIKKVDGEKYLATLEMSSKDFNPTPFNIPVIKENGDWKIFVDGSVVVDTKQ